MVSNTSFINSSSRFSDMNKTEHMKGCRLSHITTCSISVISKIYIHGSLLKVCVDHMLSCLLMVLLNCIKLITLTSCVDEGLMKDEMDDSDPGETIESLNKCRN